MKDWRRRSDYSRQSFRFRSLEKRTPQRYSCLACRLRNPATAVVSEPRWAGRNSDIPLLIQEGWPRQRSGRGGQERRNATEEMATPDCPDRATSFLDRCVTVPRGKVTPCLEPAPLNLFASRAVD